jgi:single-strand DNA-binding protein
MYGTPITIVGNAVDDVELRPTDSGISRVRFRIASTQRRRDRETGQWVDGHKLFVSVTVWRELAENVAASISKGDPIVLHGRIYSRQYVVNENSKVTYEVEVDSIGHDLSRGTAVFKKRQRGLSGSVELDADGMPIQPEDDSYELMDEQEAGTSDATRVSARTLVAAG